MSRLLIDFFYMIPIVFIVALYYYLLCCFVLCCFVLCCFVHVLCCFVLCCFFTWFIETVVQVKFNV